MTADTVYRYIRYDLLRRSLVATVETVRSYSRTALELLDLDLRLSYRTAQHLVYIVSLRYSYSTTVGLHCRLQYTIKIIYSKG